MAAVNYYEIYDVKTKKWIDGQFLAREVQKITGGKGKVHDYYINNTVINGRYILRLAEDAKEGRAWERHWSHEWDRVREKLLRSAKHGDC